MSEELNDTTRRYPRTLQEAFKSSEGYANAAFRPHRTRLRLNSLEWHAILALVLLLIGLSFL